MRLFGRKSNQQPAASDVPPELQPYYGQPKRQTWFNRARLFILPVIAAVLLIGAIVGGILWARTHTITNPFHKSGNTSQAAHNSTNNNASSNDSQSSSSSSSSSQSSQPSSNAQPQPSGSSNQTATTGTQSAMPNTGPGDEVLLISTVAGLAGAAVFHMHQVRRTKLDK